MKGRMSEEDKMSEHKDETLRFSAEIERKEPLSNLENKLSSMIPNPVFTFLYGVKPIIFSGNGFIFKDKDAFSLRFLSRTFYKMTYQHIYALRKEYKDNLATISAKRQKIEDQKNFADESHRLAEQEGESAILKLKMHHLDELTISTNKILLKRNTENTNVKVEILAATNELKSKESHAIASQENANAENLKKVDADNATMLAQSKILTDEEKKALANIIEKNMQSLKELEKFFDEELKKMSWWDNRIKLIDDIKSADWLVIIMRFIVDAVMIAIITSFTLYGVVIIGIFVSIYSPLVATIGTLIFSSETLMLLSFIVPYTLGLFGYISATWFKFDIRSQEARFNDREYSEIFNKLATAQLSEIKQQNDDISKTIDGADTNPFTQIVDNTPIKTIRDAIKARLTLFEAKKIELTKVDSSVNEEKKPQERNPLDLTPQEGPHAKL